METTRLSAGCEARCSVVAHTAWTQVFVRRNIVTFEDRARTVDIDRHRDALSNARLAPDCERQNGEGLIAG